MIFSKIHFYMKNKPSRMKLHFFPEGLFIISRRVCHFAQSSGDISARSTSSAAVAGANGIACASASSVSLAAGLPLRRRLMQRKASPRRQGSPVSARPTLPLEKHSTNASSTRMFLLQSVFAPRPSQVRLTIPSARSRLRL